MPRPDCMPIIYAISASVIISAPFSCALFFFRVKAVYYDNKVVTMFFGCLWLVLFGLSLLIPFAVEGGHVGPTQWCTVTKVRDSAAGLGFVNCVFDTLVFVAISVRIMSFAYGRGNMRTRAKTFFRGHGLGALSRSLLHGGQLYYLFVASVLLSCRTHVASRSA
jgi:hypothetical protein